VPVAPAWPLRRLWPAAAVLLLAGLVFATGWHRVLTLETLVRNRTAIADFVDSHIVLALAAFVALYIVVVALSLPGASILTVAGGILFGAITGGAVAVAGATAGAAVIFLIARSVFGGYLTRRVGPSMTKFADGFREDAFNYLLFLRLVPVFPFWLVNLAPALLDVRFTTFVLATALGIIPGTFAFAFFGTGLDSVIASQEEAYRACLASGRGDCHFEFDIGSLLTPKLIAAFFALGVLALVPVAVRRLRGHKSRL
jgi:uncharacterized membrane protein YdjX (TVP38/TMEM64 family)